MPVATELAWWRRDLVAAVLLVGMAALLLWRTDDIGPTVDEPFHLVRGLAWWWTGSTQLSYAHPPLANVLQAWPAATLSPPVDLTGLRGWDTADHAKVAGALFRQHYAVVRPLLMAGRLVTSSLALVLAAFVYGWVSRRMGPVVGLVGLVMVAYNPTVLAHGQLVTTDLPVTLAVFAVAATFADYLAAPPESRWLRWRSLGLFAGAVGLALGTKYSALALVPWLAGVGLVWAVRGWGRFGRRPGRRGLGTVALDMAVVAGVALLVLAALYRFQEVGLSAAEVLAHPEPGCVFTYRTDGTFMERSSVVALLPSWVRLPVPYTWLFGLETVRHQSTGGHTTWFMGHVYGWGNPAYFPVMIAIKTPWLVLAGFVARAWMLARARRWPDLPEGVMWLVAGGLFVVLLGANLNIGVRHALPLIPPLSVVAARGATGVMDLAQIRWGPRARTAGWVLLLTMPLAAATDAGHYLSWFNIGRAGHRISVVGEDWGQDTPRLAQDVQEHDLLPLAYQPYGSGSLPELQFRGVTPGPAPCGSVPEPDGWLAMHAARQVRRPDCIPGVTDRPPDRVVADHIYLWRLDPVEP